MVLQLHVWGPAFGLPSIDPDCLAVVAYLNHTVPRNQWTLVADHDPSYGAQGTLRDHYRTCSSDREIGQFPLLCDGNKTITGYTNIVAHIESHYSDASHGKDASTPKQRKDMVAYV